jgi:hypothetical protein
VSPPCSRAIGSWSCFDAEARAKGKSNTLPKLVVKAFSKEYFDLLRKHRELVPFLAFSTRILVVLDDLIVEVK